MNNQNQTIKYYAYVRKSSESQERQALSIPAQIDNTLKVFPGLDIEFVEDRRSAFKPNNRPNFTNMLERMKKGTRCGLIAWHPDRLSRNPTDAGTIVQMLVDGVIQELKFGSYNFDNSPEGIMMLQLALSQSQYFSAKLSKDVKRGLEKKANMGYPPGPAIPGYINVGNLKGFKEWAPDPVRFDLHRKIFDLVLSGKNPAKVWRMVNDDWGYQTLERGTKIGNKELSKSAFYRILSDIKYTANYEYPVGSGEWYKGKYPAMITMDEHDRVQILLGRKGRPRPQKNDLPYTGSMTCGSCTASISPDDKKQAICTKCKTKFSTKNATACPTCKTDLSEMENPTLLHYIYYSGTGRVDPNCQNCRKGLEINPLEAQIDQQLQAIDIDADHLSLALDYLKETEGAEETMDKKIKESRELALRNVTTSINNLDRNFNSPQNANYELYTPERYQELMSPLKEEKKSVEGQLKADKENEPKILELTRDTFNFSAYARYWLKHGDNDTKNAVLSGISPNITLNDRKLRFEAYEPYLIIKDGLEFIRKESGSSEPENNGSIKGQNDTFVSLSPYWLRGLDSNQEPSPYTFSITFVWGGLYHHPKSWMLGVSINIFIDLLLCRIVSEPSHCWAWLLITIALYALGFQTINLVFDPFYNGKLPYSTGSRSTIELPRNIELLRQRS